MTPLALITLGGMVIAAGIVLGVSALRPAPPRLSAVLTQLSAPSRPASAPPVGRWAWIPVPLSRFVHAHLGVTDADLAITDTTRPELAGRMAARAGAGLLMPATLTVVLELLGARPPLVLPGGFSLVLAGVLWNGAARDVTRAAGLARAEFRAALRSFLTLVAQERAARGSPTEALEESCRGWASWPFQLLHKEILRAELAGEQPWDALRDLGARLGVDELRSLADIVSTAADGAAVFDTLLAEARNLQHAELASQQADANATTERLIQPIALLAVGFVMLLLIPPLLRLYST